MVLLIWNLVCSKDKWLQHEKLFRPEIYSNIRCEIRNQAGLWDKIFVRKCDESKCDRGEHVRVRVLFASSLVTQRTNQILPVLVDRHNVIRVNDVGISLGILTFVRRWLPRKRKTRNITEEVSNEFKFDSHQNNNMMV